MKKNQKNNDFKIILRRTICIVVIVVSTVIYIFMSNLYKKLDKENKFSLRQIESLEDSIVYANDKKDQLVDRKNTINSDENIEAIAREQFGFIKDDEIILKPIK